jgi:pimeloyl-ACP methyl ester carboxylesterase
MKGDASLSFVEIRQSDIPILDAPSFIASTDGIKLAYYPVRAKKPIGALIFIHGGGAWSGAGYQYLAKGLSERYNVSVYLSDIRGHGNSEGPRGDAPSSTQILNDLKSLIDAVRKENQELPLYLGGHSSGAGLVLNYLSWSKDRTMRGYIFISPQFGYKSKTERKDGRNPFVRVRIPLFILYRIFRGRRFGNNHAVFFDYPEEIARLQPLIIRSITCNMSAALTPSHPQEQFGMIDRPFGLFVGRNDELFNPEKVVGYAQLPGEEVRAGSVSRIVSNENHLSILRIADALIAEAIGRIAGEH